MINHLCIWSALLLKNLLPRWVYGTACGRFLGHDSVIARHHFTPTNEVTVMVDQVTCELCKNTPIFTEVCIIVDHHGDAFETTREWYKEYR